MAKEIKLTLADKKNAGVSIPGPHRYSLSTQFKYDKDGKILRAKEVRSVDINYNSISYAISNLREASKDLTDATLEIDSYEDYGSRATDYNVIGWRLATEDEIEKVDSELLKRKKEKIKTEKLKEEKAIKEAEAILRKKKPELLKDT